MAGWGARFDILHLGRVCFVDVLCDGKGKKQRIRRSPRQAALESCHGKGKRWRSLLTTLGGTTFANAGCSNILVCFAVMCLEWVFILMLPRNCDELLCLFPDMLCLILLPITARSWSCSLGFMKLQKPMSCGASNMRAGHAIRRSNRRRKVARRHLRQAACSGVHGS